MLIVMYLIAIVAANLSVATFGPSAVVINAFVFIAADLVLRDRLHEAWRGRGLTWRMAALIAAGSLLSWLLNANAGPIALASFVAFAAAAVTDTIVYALLQDQEWFVRANGSNLVSAAVDSVLFPTIAFGALLPWIVFGQFAAKVAGGLLWSVVLRRRVVATAGRA